MTDFTTWERETLISFCQNSMKEIAKLRAELAQAKTYMPGNRAKPMPKTEPVGKTNFAFFGLIETDEEFAERAGRQIEEVTE